MFEQWIRDLGVATPPERTGPLWFLGAVAFGGFERFRKWYGGRWERWEWPTGKGRTAAVWLPRKLSDPIWSTDVRPDQKFLSGKLYVPGFVLFYDSHGDRVGSLKGAYRPTFTEELISIVANYSAYLVLAALALLLVTVLVAFHSAMRRTRGANCNESRPGQMMVVDGETYVCAQGLWRRLAKDD